MISDIVFPDAGDGCFYVGLGGKNELPKSASLEPYQCCPSKPVRGSKIAKIQPAQKTTLKTRQIQSRPEPPTRNIRGKEVATKSDKKAGKGKGWTGKYMWWW